MKMEWTKADMVGLAVICAIAGVLVVVIASAIVYEKGRCYTPTFIELEYIEDGGKTIIKTSSINMVLSLEGRTRIDMRDNQFVTVKEKVSTVKRKLCM